MIQISEIYHLLTAIFVSPFYLSCSHFALLRILLLKCCSFARLIVFTLPFMVIVVLVNGFIFLSLPS